MSDAIYPVMPGAEPWSSTHDAVEAPGALVIHGFTGNPGSMRELAEAFAKAGFHVEMPRLPGHGTALEEMLTTSWTDWLDEAEAAYQRLRQRAGKVVVAGLSMGGTLTLRIGADHPEVAGLICVNPATQPQAPEVIEVLRGMLEAGTDVMAAIGSDIADPDSKEDAYAETPIEPLLSLVEEGLAPLAARYPSMKMPLLLLHSPQDHVVDPAQAEFLASTYGGPVERVTLERSYHVATQDYDKELIFESSVAFRAARHVLIAVPDPAGAAATLLADIPSPSSGVLELGPLSIHAYGLMIALGVVAAVWLTGRRLEAKGVGTREDMSAIALWAVPAGVIGARIYHVITDWQLFEDDLGKIVQIWRGGLGIPGGMLAGSVVGLWRAKRRGLDVAMVADCAAPALPLAQAIGRWGNYFNQELFGKPTDLPWALQVSDDKATQAGYPPGTTFHPTFLYESLWNLALCGALLLIDKRFKVRPGSLMAMYVIGYGVGRFWVEGLRIDPAHSYGGLRLNQWVALGIIAAALVYLLFVSGRPVRERRPVPAADGGADEGVDDDVVTSADDDSPDPPHLPDMHDGPDTARSESDPDGEHRYVAEDG